MEKFDSTRNEMELLGFDLDDFMDDTYIEECVELIANDNFDPAIQFSSNFDYGCEGLLGDMSHGDVENEWDESSGTTATTTTTTGGNPTKRKRDDKKVDRTKTLTLERKRRTQMKGTLYELRSLVPNITKMDKASIVGDAVQYIQDLQNKIEKLQNDIASLEDSSSYSFPQQSQHEEDEGESMYTPPQLDFHVFPIQPTPIKNILQMDVIEIDKREYHGRIVCENGKGIAPSLYAALDSLDDYVDVPSSFLTTVAHTFIFTFTMKVEELGVDLNLASMKLWIASALADQGFHFVTLPFSS